MSLKLSSEQLQFQDTLKAFFVDKVSSAYLRQRWETSQDSDPLLWQEFLKMGLLSAFATENDGGLGLGATELAMLGMLAGSVILPEPLIENILAGPFFVSRILPPSEKSKVVDFQKIIDGTIRVSSYRSTALRSDKCFKLVAGLKSADYLLQTSLAHNSLFKIDKTQDCPLEDSLDKSLKRFQVEMKSGALLLVQNQHFELLLRLAKCFEICGAAQRALEMTIEHVKTRRQYDVPVGGFQAVQHKLADMHLQAEAMQSICKFAAFAYDKSPEQFELAALSAVFQTCEQGPEIIESAIQLHGGIGFTYEHDLHLLLRRARTNKALYGPGDLDSDLLLKAVS